MSEQRHFEDAVFTYSDTNNAKWVTVHFRRAKNGDITIMEIRDKESGKNIIEQVTSVSYRRLEDTARAICRT